MTPEHERLAQDSRREKNWKRWGPYLAERQWGTVREDYSADGDAWRYFPHEHARSRAYRWGEDGLLGWTDRECRLCFALALWNGRDPILKERLFGLTGPEGNQGEDVKECYHYLDSTPTHSRALAHYRYPQAEFPYRRLVEENARRGRRDPEFELEDTGVLAGGRYFDIYVEYAKAGPDDTHIRLTAWNRGPEAAPLHLLPTLWFRNSWIWGCKHEGCTLKPRLGLEDGRVATSHENLEDFVLWAGNATGAAAGSIAPAWLFTENETNTPRLFGAPSYTNFFKDAFHERVIGGRVDAVNPAHRGTKAAAWYQAVVPPGGCVEIPLRLCARSQWNGAPAAAARHALFEQRRAEADAFYHRSRWAAATDEERTIIRQAHAGLLWSKQFYHYVVADWLDGDREQPPPPPGRRQRRNTSWSHVFSRDVISMPDKWEYPWFAAWDLAFHMIPFAEIDPEFAKAQLLVFLREWYMHPNGALPAYEWNFDDVNPPVHAWAVWRVYKISAAAGHRDRAFLARAFQKLVMNFTWWVNRKDADGLNVFSGGFLGLDNVGVFDRSKPLPGGAQLQQADGTAWMGLYCGTMLSIALELALEEPVYEDLASKFFEHFIDICDAINGSGGRCAGGLWDETDGFYYDRLLTDHAAQSLKVRSVVGWLPLVAVELLERNVMERLPGFAKRARWFIANRRDLSGSISWLETNETLHHYYLLALPTKERLRRALGYLFDEEEFLSPHGLRSLSKWHGRHPYVFSLGGVTSTVGYEPGAAETPLFGGNSNWRGPVWLPVNYLFIEALERYDRFYGPSFTVEYPARSGRFLTLGDIARDLSCRVASLFLRGPDGRRPCEGPGRSDGDAAGRDHLLFHEYFHGETGQGLGASHQTGWTALAIRFLAESMRHRSEATPSSSPAAKV